tara:strand:- start:38 stop:481 length:444 start_codon:yes stop_codon:yes gene_type:complete
MNKTVSYKGQLPIGEQDRIRLKTNNGKTGYKINKFNIMPKTPHNADSALVGQVFSVDQTGSITATVDFTNSDLLAVAVLEDHAAKNYAMDNVIIFDNSKFNQDIFITMTDADGNTTPGNYYIELEPTPLSDLEATMLTLQSIRQTMS